MSWKILKDAKDNGNSSPFLRSVAKTKNSDKDKESNA